MLTHVELLVRRWVDISDPPLYSRSQSARCSWPCFRQLSALTTAHVCRFDDFFLARADLLVDVSIACTFRPMFQQGITLVATCPVPGGSERTRFRSPRPFRWKAPGQRPAITGAKTLDRDLGTSSRTTPARCHVRPLSWRDTSTSLGWVHRVVSFLKESARTLADPPMAGVAAGGDPRQVPSPGGARTMECRRSAIGSLDRCWGPSSKRGRSLDSELHDLDSLESACPRLRRTPILLGRHRVDRQAPSASFGNALPVSAAGADQGGVGSSLVRGISRLAHRCLTQGGTASRNFWFEDAGRE